MDQTVGPSGRLAKRDKYVCRYARESEGIPQISSLLMDQSGCEREGPLGRFGGERHLLQETARQRAAPNSKSHLPLGLRLRIELLGHLSFLIRILLLARHLYGRAKKRGGSLKAAVAEVKGRRVLIQHH